MSLDKIANIYQVESETFYPYENFKDENSYNSKLGNLSIEEFRSSLTAKLPTQADVDNFNNFNSRKTGKELTLEYMKNDVRIFEHCFNLFFKLNIDIYKINPLHYISLPGFTLWSIDILIVKVKVKVKVKIEVKVKDLWQSMTGGPYGTLILITYTVMN